MRAPSERLAEQPGGPEHQDEDSTTNAMTSFHCAAEDRRSRSSRPGPAQAAEQRAAQVADAAEHRGGERLDAEDEADAVLVMSKIR